MRYGHALCLYPYVVDQRPGVGIFPPTGLEYVATALKGHVERISLVDLRHERALQPLQKMAQFVRREGVDLLCTSVTWKARYRKICEYISRLPPDLMTVVGGNEATEQVEDLLGRCPNVDAVVRGEGEQTIVELAEGRPWHQILGLSYRRGDSIVHNANRPLQPIEQIIPPDRSLRRSRYFPTLRGCRLLPVEFDTVLTSRGCPYKCKFCTFTINPLGQKREYAARTPEAVVEEIASSEAKIILFADDNFFLGPRRVERLCDLLIERRIDKRFVAQARIEVFKFPRMLEKAHRAGFRLFLLGIESASDRILAQLDKGFDTEQLREAFAVLRRFPFWYHGYFIYGNVSETEAEMLAIPRFARELGVHSMGLSHLRLSKFSPLHRVVENTPGHRISSKGYVYSEEFDKWRLRRIRNQIRNQFYYRPAQIAKMFQALGRSEFISYRQMVRLAFMSPVFLWDYALHRGHRIVRRSRKTLQSMREGKSWFNRSPRTHLPPPRLRDDPARSRRIPMRDEVSDPRNGGRPQPPAEHPAETAAPDSPGRRLKSARRMGR